jgi:cell division protein FtsI/penicillin-binding protein 2
VTHAWFVGYAPAGSPEVALVVFLKRGTGGANAAPLAGQIFKQYFAEKARTR